MSLNSILICSDSTVIDSPKGIIKNKLMGMNIHPTSHINSKKTQIERNEEEEEYLFTHSERVQDHVEGSDTDKNIALLPHHSDTQILRKRSSELNISRESDKVHNANSKKNVYDIQKGIFLFIVYFTARDNVRNYFY
jgi:hypothetical protein